MPESLTLASELAETSAMALLSLLSPGSVTDSKSNVTIGSPNANGAAATARRGRRMGFFMMGFQVGIRFQIGYGGAQ
jgi:hypothetical protein